MSARSRGSVEEEEFLSWFDVDGRLVREASMRQAVFEAAVAPSCRRSLWKFLFGLYPMTSTHHERKIIDTENRSSYQALRQRWEVLDRTVSPLDDDFVQPPSYLALSDGESDEDDTAGIFLTNEHRIKNTSISKCDSKPGTETDSDTWGHGPATLRTKSEPSQVQLDDDLAHRGKSLCLNAGADEALPGRSAAEAHVEIHVRANSSSDFASGDAGPLEKSGARGESSHSSERPFLDSSDFDSCSTSTTGYDSVSPALRSLVSSGSTGNGGAVTFLDGEDRSECCCDFRRRSYSEVVNDGGKSLLSILEFPSRVFATRQPVDLEKSYPKAKRIILRDVLRTDRYYHYFSHKRNLRKVHRILMIYAMFHPDIGYAQGMNDILARFLVVTESEVDSYWLFVKYMEQKRADFLEDTMLLKVGLVKSLLVEMDEELGEFFERSECKDYLFCHRWLLLDFKREFSFEDGIRIFEVLSSHYLELNSDQGLKETDKAIAEEFAHDRGELRAKRGSANPDFTFDLFICVAILLLYRSDIRRATDAAGVYGCLNGLSMNMSCTTVLTKAEQLFYDYCRLSVSRGFNEVSL